MADKIPPLRVDLAKVAKRARLMKAVDDVDKIIARLAEAREQIAAGQDPHTASLVLTKLQNPIKEAFETVNEDLKAVSKTQKEFGKTLDRSFPATTLPTDHDAMAEHPALINRAIAMHLLREGQFSVASTFMEEAREMAKTDRYKAQETATNSRGHGGSSNDEHSHDHENHNAASTINGNNRFSPVTTPRAAIANFSKAESLDLQAKFRCMYTILESIQACHLEPAIDWARAHSVVLEERGSNLEFELCKLQFVWLAKQAPQLHQFERLDEGGDRLPGGWTVATATSADNLRLAFAYARDHFSRFHERHLHEIQRLAAALVFGPNLSASPYARFLDTTSAFDDVAATFTREFCSLLGLSAESPLYVAATAGAIALPRLIKFIGATRSKRTEWTTANELAFETPLPSSMFYHSIFVCPVSKEQTTEENPPMRLPCGHVLARESLQNLAKGGRFKCPYCPLEGNTRDAQRITL